MLHNNSKMSAYEQEHKRQNIIPDAAATTIRPTTVSCNISAPATPTCLRCRPFSQKRLLFPYTVQQSHQQQKLQNLSVAIIAVSSILHRSSDDESEQRRKSTPSSAGSVQISPFLAMFVTLSMALICSVTSTQAMPYGVVSGGVGTISGELPNGAAQFSPFSSSMSNNAAALYLRFRKGVAAKETNDNVQPFIRFRKSLTETWKTNDKLPKLMERRLPIDGIDGFY